MEKTNTQAAGETYLSQPINATIMAFHRWRDTNLGTSIKIILLLILVTSLFFLGFGIAGVISAGSAGLFNPGVTGAEIGDWFSSQGWLYVLGIFLGLVFVNIPFNIALEYSFITAQSGRKVGTKDSIKRGYSRMFVAIATGFLTTLILLVGFIALIVPGVYIALRLSYLNSIIANEDLGPIDSIKRSWALTKGNLWDIIGAFSVGMILSAVFSLLTTLATSTSSSIDTFIVLVLSIASMIFGLIAAQVYYFRYHQSSREKAGELTKEGTDKLNYILPIVAIFFLVMDSSTTNRATAPSLPQGFREA